MIRHHASRPLGARAFPPSRPASNRGAAAAFGAALALTLAPLAEPAPAASPGDGFGPYYQAPCADRDRDGIEDALQASGAAVIDGILVFDGANWNPGAARKNVQRILNENHSSATIVYVGSWSPYVFLHNLPLGGGLAHTAVPLPADLSGLLGLPGVRGIRAYQRFVLKTTVVSGTFTLPELGLPTAPSPVPTPIPSLPATLVYFVDSGIDGPDQYWGIDAALQDPLEPKRAVDPNDLTTIRHGTFVKGVAQVAWTRAAGGVAAAAIRAADVRVAVGPNGETTTLELTRGFDAIVAHLKYERAQGRLRRSVINVSYDTDGGIANHDIIYPAPGRSVDPRGTHVDLAGGEPLAGESPPHARPDFDPCGPDLFDDVFRTLTEDFDCVVSVGAGNDGREAEYVINPIGQSIHVTIVAAAFDLALGAPADYSCYGTAPGGILQNGHPNLVATGLGQVAEFDYRLEGTSISTGYTSGMAAALLLQQPRLEPKAVRDHLVAKGVELPETGDRWYGAARLLLPWERLGPHPGRPSRLELLRYPGTGSRLRVEQRVDGPLAVRLFTVSGRLVRTLLSDQRAAGGLDIEFDGLGDGGAPLPGGLYFLRSTSPSGSSVTKLLIQR